MKLYTSYFYMVRFLRPYEIPVSTAVWDPKWFHDFKGQEHVFMDKRGVINGIRGSMFMPDETCSSLCHGREGCPAVASSCAFMQGYMKQLSHLDFDVFMKDMNEASKKFGEQMKLDRPVDFVFLVHEAPDNPCSERVIIQAWFSAHGYPISEWKRPFK